ncbi:MAG: nitroreductase family protein [Bacteroidota bacterium]
MIRELIIKNRSYRRFDESARVALDELKEFIDLARLSASARNMQSLRYVLSTEPGLNEKIFSTLGWAGYLKDWDGPVRGERPAAYIVMMNDDSLTKNYFCDDGIAAQSILLGAVEKGYGGCIIASVNKKKLAEALQLDENYSIIQVIALGRPAEKVVLEEVEGDDIKYWRDSNDVHHVPKRALDDLIVGEAGCENRVNS